MNQTATFNHESINSYPLVAHQDQASRSKSPSLAHNAFVSFWRTNSVNYNRTYVRLCVRLGSRWSNLRSKPSQSSKLDGVYSHWYRWEHYQCQSNTDQGSDSLQLLSLSLFQIPVQRWGLPKTRLVASWSSTQGARSPRQTRTTQVDVSHPRIWSSRDRKTRLGFGWAISLYHQR